MLRSRNSDGIFSFYFRMAITAPIAPLQTPVQKAHLKAIVNRCQKILFLFIFRFVNFITLVTPQVTVELRSLNQPIYKGIDAYNQVPTACLEEIRYLCGDIYIHLPLA